MGVPLIAGRRPEPPGVLDGRLSPCPRSPGCVCSDAAAAAHAVAPWRLRATPEHAWSVVRTVLPRQPRTSVITITADYLHAECRSRILGFVDDLELHLRPARGIIAVRSASRVGFSDFGVNRRRVEALGAVLRAAGAIE